jgi:phytoene dehydrogenase-like protein
MTRITIVGAGLAGLTAAIACAEAGADVVVHEAHAVPGGRARTTAPPWIAHEGPHVFYADGPHWPWLVQRDLVGRATTLPLAEARGVRIHRDGRLRRTLPAGVLSMAAHRRRRAPVDRNFFSWAAELHGEATARMAANAMGVVTYDSDPGRLSATPIPRYEHTPIRRVSALLRLRGLGLDVSPEPVRPSDASRQLSRRCRGS